MGMIRLRPGLALLLMATIAVLAFVAPAVTLRAQAPAAPPKTDTAKPTAPAPLPSARSIIDRHVAAIGGREAVLSHSSTKAIGTFSVTSAGMSGALEVYASKPNKTVVKIKIPGVGEIVEGFNGTHGWTVSDMTGPMLLDGKQLEEKKFDADYYSDLHDDSRYESMTTVELTDFDSRQCYKIRLVRKGASEDFEFYDVKTGLKAGRTGTRETPMGTVTGTSIESDYKKFGNLLVPTTVKNSVMGVQQVITIESIEYDTVQPSVFDPPAEIKALIK